MDSEVLCLNLRVKMTHGICNKRRVLLLLSVGNNLVLGRPVCWFFLMISISFIKVFGYLVEDKYTDAALSVQGEPERQRSRPPPS